MRSVQKKTRRKQQQFWQDINEATIDPAKVHIDYSVMEYTERKKAMQAWRWRLSTRWRWWKWRWRMQT